MPDALVAGILAGYAIAIPVGPIAVLIFETGVRRGAVAATAAGTGAASADGFYATVAALVGAALAGAITPVIGPARILGGAVLASIAAHSLWTAWRARVATGPQAAGDPATPGGPSAALDRSMAGEGVRTYLLFLGLTIVNPMTFLYFGALMLGLPPAAGSGGRVLFVAGAFAASLSWQLLLAGAGSALHGHLSPRLQAATRVVGALIVLAFAARLALTAG